MIARHDLRKLKLKKLVCVFVIFCTDFMKTKILFLKCHSWSKLRFQIISVRYSINQNQTKMCVTAHKSSLQDKNALTRSVHNNSNDREGSSMQYRCPLMVVERPFNWWRLQRTPLQPWGGVWSSYCTHTHTREFEIFAGQKLHNWH